jgi:hypothetical protein
MRSNGWRRRQQVIASPACTVPMGVVPVAAGLTAAARAAAVPAGIVRAGVIRAAPAIVFFGLATASAGLATAQSALATADSALREVVAGAPTDLSVTVYRSPGRLGGAIDLDSLEGFALVTETRPVDLPAGESRLRFPGVADAIEPVTALLTGLGAGVTEKNLDAKLLSPSALVAAAGGETVELTRTDRKTGRVERLGAKILSDADDGVVFETGQGIEALRCSGLPEQFVFAGVDGLESHPSLSVRVRTPHAISTQVTLSYLARGFDWAATYHATVAADETHMDLGAWVTLANGNGVGFPAAHAQVVAGRVNRENDEVIPIDIGGPILATCWPRGSTSDVPVLVQRARVMGVSARVMSIAAAPAAAFAELEEVVVSPVSQEQLGDLKLYRVPDRTTVASRESKQVRLLDRASIPIDVVYRADIVIESGVPEPAAKVLRTKNEEARHLGLPLPSGRVALFARRGSAEILESESDLRDTAVGEDVEMSMGPSSDVEFNAWGTGAGHEVDITNARGRAVELEVRLHLDDGVRLVRANRRSERKNGQPLFRLRIPAQSSLVLTYETQRVP